MKNFKEIAQQYLNKNKKYDILTVGIENDSDFFCLKNSFIDSDITSIVSNISEINFDTTRIIEMEANNFRGLRMLFFHSRFDCIIDNRTIPDNEKMNLFKYLFEIIKENGIYIINNITNCSSDNKLFKNIENIEFYNSSVLIKQN